MRRRTTPQARPVALARRVAQSLLVVLALVAVPDSAVHPASYSLVALADAKAVDFDDGIVWFLLLGSDARDGEDVTSGRADAIELVGLDFDTGRADRRGRAPGHLGRHPRPRVRPDQRRPARRRAGAGRRHAVESLVGIPPDYVFTAGFDGFVSMVDSIGPVPVVSRFAFQPPDGPVSVRRGLNRMDGQEALAFARARVPLPRSDFDRIANHHSLMKGILRALRGGEDTAGFIEHGSAAALRGLETDLSPVALYRLAQAVTTFRVTQVTTCAIFGVPRNEGGADVLYVDPDLARRVGRDVRDDARIDEGCG